jgi:GeoRSP system PqqD family protein
VSPAPRYFRDPDAVWREEELPEGEPDESAPASTILCRGKMISLNVLGTEIWKLCDGKTAAEMVDALAATFEVERDVLEQDVAAFLASLVEHKAVDAR